MKRILIILSSVFLLASCAFAGPYMQASSSITQCPANTSPVKIKMDQDDGSQGIVLTAKSQFKVTKAGSYVVIAAPQVGRAYGQGMPGGDFKCFIGVNGVPVANSNVLMNFDKNYIDKDVIITQGILKLKKGDKVTVWMSVSNPDAGLCIEAIQPPGEPLVPSIIFTMYQL
jgi:hypothetical protein